MPNFHVDPLAGLDFFKLMEVFSNLDKTKQFLGDVKAAIEDAKIAKAEADAAIKAAQDGWKKLDNETKLVAGDKAKLSAAVEEFETRKKDTLKYVEDTSKAYLAKLAQAESAAADGLEREKKLEAAKQIFEHYKLSEQPA